MKKGFRHIGEKFRGNKELAQSASELAIFGAILLFVVGMVLRAGMSNSHNMNAQLRAMRWAMTESYRTSEGIYGGDPTHASRNSATVLLIEDRLSVGVDSKLESRDRIPYIAAASAMFSKNLFYPTDFGDENLPIYDVIVNGQRFPLTLARYITVNLPVGPTAEVPQCGSYPYEGPRCWDPGCNGGQGCVILHKQVGNYAASSEWDEACDLECFDLDFDGIQDVPSATITKAEFSWQWKPVEALGGNVDVENQRNVLLDVDGDFKEELIFGVVVDGTGRITSFQVSDNQAGDMDFSWDDRDEALRIANGLPPHKAGIQDDIQMFSFTQPGTVLRIEEGKLFEPADGGQFIRNTTRQEQVDIVQRGFFLANDTDRFCDANGNPTPTVSGMTNPVQACNNCFEPNKIELTCMDEGFKVIFIRSRIEDLRGRRWVTRFEAPP